MIDTTLDNYYLGLGVVCVAALIVATLLYRRPWWTPNLPQTITIAALAVLCLEMVFFLIMTAVIVADGPS